MTQRLKSACRGVGNLGLRKELKRVATLFLGTVARALATAEWHVRVDAGGRHVDHHHPRFGIALEMRRVFERGRDDTGRKTELGIVRSRKRLVVVLDPDDRRNRPKYLFAADAHLVGGFGE